MTPQSAKRLAFQIRVKLGGRIRLACAESTVPEHFLAGLISVENPGLSAHVASFEKIVLANLKRLRSPLIFWRTSWNGITQADLKGKSDAELIDLATSFGYTQIMGWWSLRLNCSVADIRDTSKHLQIAVRLLQRVAGPHLIARRFDNVLRNWGTGSPKLDPAYVLNALAVMDAYKALIYPAFTSPRQPPPLDAPATPPSKPEVPLSIPR